jgi:hypothetical protein
MRLMGVAGRSVVTRSKIVAVSKVKKVLKQNLDCLLQLWYGKVSSYVP